MRWLSLLLFLSVVTRVVGQLPTECLWQTLQEQGNAVYEGNTNRFLPSAAAKYEEMFRDIRNAQSYVHLEYFRVRNDSVGGMLLRLLEEKAREGVEVRMLVDGYGNSRNQYPLTREHLNRLNDAGVRTAVFDPVRFPWVNHIQHRDHRKIVVVDGLRVYTGGMNVGDYYLTGTARSGPWRDMHVCFEGAVVDGYERIFARMWERVSGEHLDSLYYHRSVEPVGEQRIVLVNREPGTARKRMWKAYKTCIDSARREIRIVNPYPTGVRVIRRALRRALKRGVSVKVMASAHSDIPVVPDVVAVEMNKLSRKGGQVYYYETGFHHSKLMTVDGLYCTVGTANLDGRSMSRDYEVNAFIFDPQTTAQLDSVFDEDKKDCFLLDSKKFKKRFSLGHRLLGRLFNPLKGLF